jgi:hypothetical protein
MPWYDRRLSHFQPFQPLSGKKGKEALGEEKK